MQLMAFADDVVAFYKGPEQVRDLIFQLRGIVAASGLRINIKKTRVMKIERSIRVSGEIPRKSINKLLNKLFCERCDRYCHNEMPFQCHRRSRFCDGTKNRSRTGTLPSLHGRQLVTQLLRNNEDDITVCEKR
eukprot:snap_masked-scaffold_1-processed-gene-0.31-mRNA-1 protein AED:1.00 eAED:1.00 QI:0/-1/0/0/-1/1/1/0/132